MIFLEVNIDFAVNDHRSCSMFKVAYDVLSLDQDVSQINKVHHIIKATVTLNVDTAVLFLLRKLYHHLLERVLRQVSYQRNSHFSRTFQEVQEENSCKIGFAFRSRKFDRQGVNRLTVATSDQPRKGL